jgi:hypothetical protein
MARDVGADPRIPQRRRHELEAEQRVGAWQDHPRSVSTCSIFIDTEPS